MTSMLTSEVLAKQAEREELEALVADFLAKNKAPVTEPVQPGRAPINMWRARGRAEGEAAEAAKLKRLADKHCARPAPAKPDMKQAIHAKSAKTRQRRKELAPAIAAAAAEGLSTNQIAVRLNVAFATIKRAAEEHGITLQNKRKAARPKE